MKLVRPYIPLDVRLVVARRQYNEWSKRTKQTADLLSFWKSKEDELWTTLCCVFGYGVRLHLDHDPPLMNRQFNKRTGKYKPDANDPNYLIYRKADDHKTKTFIRGDGALRSDVSQRRYLNRVAANRKPKKKFKPRRAKHIRRIHVGP